MPRVSNKNNENIENETVVAETPVSSTPNIDLQALLSRISELESALAKAKSVEDVTSSSEPDFNKNIRLVSQYYGVLNLSTEPNGRGRLVTFDRYGQVRNVLYSTLVDLVNNNRRFSEEGYFYILDKDAVYNLGLSEFYEDRILSKEVMDKICDYDKEEIADILSNATEVQKETIVRNLVDKVASGADVDMNKCIYVGDVCGVKIMEKVSELKSFEK